MLRIRKLKLAWRVVVLTLLATAGTVYVSVLFFIHHTDLGGYEDHHVSYIYKPLGKYHLRKLVDKSSGGESNLSTNRDYQMPDDPAPNKKVCACPPLDQIGKLFLFVM